MSENKIIAAIEFDHNDAKDMNTIADYIRDELASSFVKKRYAIWQISHHLKCLWRRDYHYRQR